MMVIVKLGAIRYMLVDVDAIGVFYADIWCKLLCISLWVDT